MAQACASGFVSLPENIQRALILQLLCNISGTSASGVTQAQLTAAITAAQQVYLFQGFGPPVFIPNTPSLPAMAYSEDASGPTYTWNVALQIWL